MKTSNYDLVFVAAACEFPDARTPAELFDVALSRRVAFRKIPRERLDLADYVTRDGDPDGLHRLEAGLLRDYVFDRRKFFVATTTYERTDMAHWLALDVASRVVDQLPGLLDDANAADSTAVIVANTLTGEFSRAAQLRYRWPYVARAASKSMGADLSTEQRNAFIGRFESEFKAPFPAPDEDSLAGSLANTIAGRICNYFGLHGGAYTVDGACASSLVAVLSAVDRIKSGSVSTVIVGGVDLSLDPFELVGFARNGALAREPMRIFDSNPTGFWPGEGCGFVALTTADMARSKGWNILANVRGIGMSTDGKGGLTRPSPSGQLLALRRAWEDAEMPLARLDYIEAHGTGTPTGDPVEVEALATLLDGALLQDAVPVGSIKANIGHTKAAAGMAGLLKALEVCRQRVVPSTTGVSTAMDALAGGTAAQRLRVLAQAQTISHSRGVVAGVNSFGFGGVNCHVIIEGPPLRQPKKLPVAPRVQGDPDMEGALLCFSADSREGLVAVLESAGLHAATLARSELRDFAHTCPPMQGAHWRAALVCTSPSDLERQIAVACADLRSCSETWRLADRWAWSGPVAIPAPLAFMFPGQGVSYGLSPQVWTRRFPELGLDATELHELESTAASNTETMQTMLAKLAIAGQTLLERMGVRPVISFGHSFGEICAFHAAGAISEEDLMQIASLRGRCINLEATKGAMLSVRAPFTVAERIAHAADVDIACRNGREAYVLAGLPAAIQSAADSCKRDGLAATLLPSAYAFHSRHMTGARTRFSGALARHRFGSQCQPVASTITGTVLQGVVPDDLLARQLTDPVLFSEALALVKARADLVIEVGPRSGLASLLQEEQIPVAQVALASENLCGLLLAVGAAWARGHDIDPTLLYKECAPRTYDFAKMPSFLRSPCGTGVGDSVTTPSPQEFPHIAPLEERVLPQPSADLRHVVLQVLSEQTGLPADELPLSAKLLADLHLNSIRVRQVAALAARSVGMDYLSLPPGDIATATIEGLVERLEAARDMTARNDDAKGVAAWARSFSYDWHPEDNPSSQVTPCLMSLVWIVPDSDLPTIDAGTNAPVAVAVRLYAKDAEQYSELLLQSIQALASGKTRDLCVFQDRQVSNAFFRSVAQELDGVRITVATTACLDQACITKVIAQHAAAINSYNELVVQEAITHKRAFRLLEESMPSDGVPLDESDVVMISGGAKGIGFASAEAIGLAYGCSLALVGRSPDTHPDVCTALENLARAGIRTMYVQADLTEPQQACMATKRIQTAMGQITAIIHSAGINAPRRAIDLTRQDLDHTVAVKVSALDHMLDSLEDLSGLHLVVAYGSIIGELGLPGEAHYALANELLSQRMRELASQSAWCRFLTISWSAWADIGMAANLPGVMSELKASGTWPLSPALATAELLRLLNTDARGSVVVTGRYGRIAGTLPDVLATQHSRYLEQIRQFYPGVELVADAEVSTDSDPYLLAHAPFGVVTFPLVAAIEAMCSAAQALDGSHKSASLRISALNVGAGIQLLPGQQVTIRTCALRYMNSVQVEVRSSLTGFTITHFSAKLTLDVMEDGMTSPQYSGLQQRDVLAGKALYEHLVFHRGPFEVVRGYSRVSSTDCVATCHALDDAWYSRLLPARFSAGHPAIRDAVMHALQACIPTVTVLPVYVDSISLGAFTTGRDYRVIGKQIACEVGNYTFDVDVLDDCNRLVERWQGLRLVAVRSTGDQVPAASLPVALVSALAGRLLSDDLSEPGGSVAVVQADERGGTQEALATALRTHVEVQYEPSGRPTLASCFVSSSHSSGLTLSVVHPQHPVGCDIQFVPPLDDGLWLNMLNADRFGFARLLAQVHGIEFRLAATLCWTLEEALLKLGRSDWPFRVEEMEVRYGRHRGLIAVFKSGTVRAVTGTSLVTERDAEVVVAIALQNGQVTQGQENSSSLEISMVEGAA